MNFLFVNPRYANPGQLYNFPLGMAYVSASMKAKGFNVCCLNLCHYSEPVDNIIAEWIKNNSIDVLCTGAMSIYWAELSHVLEAAKKAKPDIINVVGGAIITSDPEMAMQNLKIDYGVIGEGEITMVEAAEALSCGKEIGSVKGVVYFDKSHNLVKTGSREAISELDILPLPDYEGFEFGKFLSWMKDSDDLLFTRLDGEPRLVEIIASRGCPFSCTFCYHPLGKKYRKRSLDNVFKEIEYLVKTYKVNLLSLLDELFSENKERIIEFARRIEKYHLRWFAQWRVGNIDEETVKSLKKSGILLVGFGVEAMSNTILKSMKKHTTTSEIENDFKLLLENNICPCGNIILGDPQETEETANESIGWYIKHPEYNINLGFIQAVPDSQDYRYALANSIIKDKLCHVKEKFPLINMSRLSDGEFKKLKTKVYRYEYGRKNYLPARLLSSKCNISNENGKRSYNLEVACPLCGCVSVYKNFKKSTKHPFASILCKNCGKRLKIKTRQAFPEEYSFFSDYLPYLKRMLVYGYLLEFDIFHKAFKQFFQYRERLLKK
ncbi:MAG: radical SAM protein [Candidatus Omnitrophica bacterium]|nr:radical SAM protein [Candidatus Omnitrophota bacterium]